MDLVKINLSGTVFLLPKDVILSIPQSRLALDIQSGENYNQQLEAHYFDRRPDLFQIILQAHKEGVAHIPTEACTIEVLMELDFWMIPRSMIGQCCMQKVKVAISEKKIAYEVREEIFGSFERSVKCYKESTGWKRKALRTWIFLEFPVSSKPAKCWSIFMAVVVIIWELISLVWFDLYNRDPVLNNLFDQRIFNMTIYTLIQSDKWRRIWMAPQNHISIIITSLFDVIFLSILFIELIIRIMTCPYRMVFLKSKKLLDAFIIFTTVVFEGVVLPLHFSRILIVEPLAYSYLVYVFTCGLRPFLMSRLDNTFIGIRVMIIVLCKSLSKLLTIFCLLLCLVLFFGFFIFLAEIAVDVSFYSAWEGCWWALVTMSTVGYGDLVPHSWAGHICGALCIFCGMIVTNLSIPIISNSFNRYYDHVNAAMLDIQRYAKKNNL